MIGLQIDNRPVAVEAGATILQAARKLGIPIPTLCCRQGHPPQTSCMVCLVKVRGLEGLVPSCAARAEEGMHVESQSEEVLQARRTALELLLAEHLGDCIAPCQMACPAHVPIPRMIRRIAAGDAAGATETIASQIALPRVLGRICHAPCEKACRRRLKDAPVAICLLKRYAADAPAGASPPWRPECKADSGKKVAVIGSGPAGLTAAFFLQRDGHACTVFDRRDQAGGSLLGLCREGKLPPAVLEAEIDVIRRLGAEFRLGVQVGQRPGVKDLLRDFDAVILAGGEGLARQAGELGLPQTEGRVATDRHTLQTEQEGLFAAGGAVRGHVPAIRAAADGRTVAASVDQYLRDEAPAGIPRPFSTHVGRLLEGEIDTFLLEASPAGRQQPVSDDGGFDEDQARREALRCLHCDCRKADDCRLRDASAACGADPTRYRTQRRRFEQDRRHPEVLFEPGKCIKCGLCVQITTAAAQAPGLALLGRGFDARVGVPFNESLAAALAESAAEVIAACPTGALAFHQKRGYGTGLRP